jgi:hypothetical protein
MTGDDWSVIVRDLMSSQVSNTDAVLVACFFSSFQLLITMCMINVVVCVLVDSFNILEEVRGRVKLSRRSRETPDKLSLNYSESPY